MTTLLSRDEVPTTETDMAKAPPADPVRVACHAEALSDAGMDRAVFEAAFSPLFAILGIIFVPFTTLMYALLWSPSGLTGFDFVWLGLALLIDIGGAAAGGGRWWRRNEPNAYGM